jgi:hypothetical protein
MNPSLPILLSALLLAGSAPLLPGERNLIPNPGLEKEDIGWKTPYIPEDSQEKGCAFQIVRDGESRDGQACGRMDAEQNARFAISALVAEGLEGGKYYTLTLWIRADESFKVESGTAGFVIRLDPVGADPGEKGRNIHFDWKGERLSSIREATTEAPPRKWTQVEVEFQLPENVEKLRCGLWYERAQGKLYFDDVSLTVVP